MNQCPRSLLNQGAGGREGARAKMLFIAGGVLFGEGGRFVAITRASVESVEASVLVLSLGVRAPVGAGVASVMSVIAR